MYMYVTRQKRLLNAPKANCIVSYRTAQEAYHDRPTPELVQSMQRWTGRYLIEHLNTSQSKASHIAHTIPEVIECANLANVIGAIQ